PLTFRAQGAALSRLAVGQPVKVFVHTRAFVRGVPVPSSAVMRNASNQNIVWVKTAPEKFEPRVVTVEPLDGVNVAVSNGLKVGDRVATQGATLINQVRGEGHRMFKWLLANSLSNRLLVLIASVVVMAYGAWPLAQTPVDVFP